MLSAYLGLKTNLDDVRKNIRGTKYRNQINKVANAVKEIISGLKTDSIGAGAVRKEFLPAEDKPLVNDCRLRGTDIPPDFWNEGK